MLAVFASSESSRSLRIPAWPHVAMPPRHTATPLKTTQPLKCPSSSGKPPAKIGGISVPKAAQKPSVIA